MSYSSDAVMRKLRIWWPLESVHSEDELLGRPHPDLEAIRTEDEAGTTASPMLLASSIAALSCWIKTLRGFLVVANRN